MRIQHCMLNVLGSLCDETNTPYSAKLKDWALKGKVAEIVAERLDPRNYESPESFYKDYVVSEFLRKFGDFDLGRDLKQEAISNFEKLEERNGTFNRYFQRLHLGNELNIVDSRMLDFLQNVKSMVGRLLGDGPRALDGRFGKGSTFADVGRFVTIPDKMSSQPTVTEKARCFIPLWAETAWARSLISSYDHSEPVTVRGNRFTSVPKTATGERGICIEPSLNVYWQLAVGTEMKSRLQRFGYNLYNAQDRHRYMACHGSSTQRWATIDLKDASDLFSYQFVRMVMPSDWFEVLDSLRAEYTEVGGKWVKVQKFSSMGNGFTFEMMTVILTAICLVLSEGKYKLRNESKRFDCDLSDSDGDISVFGDDIIVPADIGILLTKCLPALGLMVNEKKTFLHGPFRESCGGDFFSGTDVRPFNLKKDPNDPSKLIGLANAIRRLGRQHRQGVDGFPSYLRTWFRVLDTIPSDVRRLRGPEYLGDLVIHDSEERWCKRSAEHLHYRETPDKRKFVRGYTPIFKRLKLENWKSETQLAAALYGIPSSGIVPRQGGDYRVIGYRKRWLALGL